MGEELLVNLVCNQEHDGKFSKPMCLNASKSAICPDSEGRSFPFGESFVSSGCQIGLYFIFVGNTVELILTKLFQINLEATEDEKSHRINFKKTVSKKARGA